MRRALLAAAFLVASCLNSPVLAATFVTSGTSCNGSACGTIPAKLAAFDSSIGTLETVIVEVNVDSIRPYIINFNQYASPDPLATTGSAHLAYTGPFSFNLNGAVYSLAISGDQNTSFTIADLGFPSGEFHATGATTFSVDPTLLSTFISGSANCGAFVCAIGLASPASIQNSVVSSSNVSFIDFDGAALSAFKLTYVYRSAVPEPGSWLMMLLGFAAIGAAVSARKRLASVPAV